MTEKRREARLNTGKVVEYIETANPPSGQQKSTFFGPDRSYVVQFYKDGRTNDPQRLARLEEVINGQHNITR